LQPVATVIFDSRTMQVPSEPVTYPDSKSSFGNLKLVAKTGFEYLEPAVIQ
jgi:hypothetical protein